MFMLLSSLPTPPHPPLQDSGTEGEDGRGLVPRGEGSQFCKVGSGTAGILSESAMIIGSQGTARFLDLTPPHLPSLRPFQELKKINTILASSRLQLSAFARVAVPLNLWRSSLVV